MLSQKIASKRIKILFIEQTSYLGGPQLALATDLAFLDRNKFEPYLLIDKQSSFQSLYKKSRVKILKINFERLKKIHPAALPELLNSLKEFLKILDQIKPDIVVTNSAKGFVLAGLAKDINLSRKILGKKQGQNYNFKLVSRIWDYDYPKWLLSSLGLSVNKFLLLSKSIQKFYKLPQFKSEVIYLGRESYAQAKGKEHKAKLEKLKKQLEIKKGDFVVGFVGRLVEWKGPMFLLDGFRRIDDPKFKLIFFGTSQGEKEDIEQQLRQEIKKRKLEGRVLLAGFIADQALIYKSINCFVQASIEGEPFAINMIEAALTKVPIIATHIGGTPEFLKSGKNGLLIKPKDTKQLTQALLRLYKDEQVPASGSKKLVKRLTKNAYKDAQKFTEEKFIRRLEEIFSKVTSN